MKFSSISTDPNSHNRYPNRNKSHPLNFEIFPSTHDKKKQTNGAQSPDIRIMRCNKQNPDVNNCY